MSANVGVTAAHLRRRDHVRTRLRRQLAPLVVAAAEFSNQILGTTDLTVSDAERTLARNIEQLLDALALRLNRP